MIATKILSLLLFPLYCFAISNLPAHSIFGYDPHFFSIPGKNTRTMICFHGYGGNYQIAQALKKLNIIDATLVSFNFPDHDIKDENLDLQKVTFGTIQELLPALYTLKKYVIDEKLAFIDLYGFSAGGGAIVNLIATLNTSTFDAELQHIGIGSKEKKILLHAIQQGLVILDTPLKSADEILDLTRESIPSSNVFSWNRKELQMLEIIAKKYHDNRLRPIDSLESLNGLSLDIILHFQHPDETLFNRDDALYSQRLLKANAKGTTTVIIGNDGGHKVPHWSLWQFYAQKITTR